VMRRFLKAALQILSLAAALPAAGLAGFGRWRSVYSTFATAFALAPGIVGDYLRIAYYRLTLAECSLSSRIQFGSFFAHPDARVAP
jgi:hypothetical protein